MKFKSIYNKSAPQSMMSKYLTTTDFIWDFGIPIGVFADNHDRNKDLSKGSGPKTGEDGVMRKTIHHFESAEKTFDRYGHNEKDILFQLDPSVVRGRKNSDDCGSRWLTS